MKNIFIKIALFILCACLSTSAIAQQQQLPTDQVFIIDDFSRLLMSHVDPYNLKGGEASDAYNVRANEQFGALAKRTVLNLLGTCSHSAAVTGLYRYYKSDGTKYTVASSSTFLDYISDTGSCTTIDAQLTTGKRWSFITYKNWLIGTDGYDNAIKWDGKTSSTADTVGARTANDLVTTLGSPFSEIATGAGLTASRWYQYKIAYYDGVTYKYSTSRTNPLLLGTVSKQIKLTDIPLGPSGTTQRIIYRTVGDTTRANVLADNTFYRVVTISDNTTTTYTDAVADATIVADTVPTWATVSAGTNVTPPHGIFPFIHKEYIWLGNDPSGTQYGTSTVYHSVVGNPDYWKPTDYFLIRPDDGDSVQAVTSFLGTLSIGKDNSWSKIYTDSTSESTWQVSQPFSFIGVAAPYSVKQTPLGIIYLGRYGLFKFDGQASTLISDAVTKEIKDINPTNFGNVAGIFYNNEYRMAYTSQATGSATNDRVLLLDMIRNSFVKDTENVNTWALYNSGDDFGALYSGSSSTSGQILAHTTQPTNVVVRYLSDLQAGLFTGTYAIGDDLNDPNSTLLSLGWDKTWSTITGTWASQGSATWQVQQSPGYWTSPIFTVNATGFSKLYWNQVLGSVGSASIAMRSGATMAAVNASSWSSEFTNSAGSDVSGVTGNIYVQLRVKLSTSDFSMSPYLYIQDNYMIKLVYSKTGNAAETSVLSVFTGGWIDLVPGASSLSNYPKLVKEIDVYYEGTEGTINLNFQNLKGDSFANFSVDLSKNRLATTNYWGYGTSKVFRWLPNFPGAATNTPIYGDKLQMTISENGVTSWKVQRIVIRYDVQPYKPYS